MTGYDNRTCAHPLHKLLEKNIAVDRVHYVGVTVYRLKITHLLADQLVITSHLITVIDQFYFSVLKTKLVSFEKCAFPLEEHFTADRGKVGFKFTAAITFFDTTPAFPARYTLI